MSDALPHTAATLKRRYRVLKRLKERNLAPVTVLLLAAVVGGLAGFTGVLFERGVNWVSEYRVSSLSALTENKTVLIPLMFIISALLAMSGYWLVRRFSPESGGSGIPEIEGALQDVRPVRWWRVLPVKFIGGLGTLGSGMVLGREGPTVQLGANISGLVSALTGVKNKESRHTLLATGAAAGLTAAFNAPLAGILFIIEEMRPQFRYSLISIKAVFIGVIMSSIVFQTFNSGSAILDIGKYHAAPLNTLWLYLVLGMVFGVIGVMFNRFLLTMQTLLRRFYQDKTSRFVATGGLIGGLCGIAGLYWPQVTGGGFAVIPDVAALHYSLTGILMIFLFRVLTTVICFSSGAPGGIFAPTLALGTLFGSFFGYAAMLLFPQYQIEPATFAIAGMGALFAATVRAPLTGIVLVLEMTDNYQLILPMIITCLGATLVAQYLGGRPLYSVLLERILMQNGTPPEKTGDAPRG